uniref:Uncharacterized protein n=1 Tax=Daphnia galeata TaxID=27404 RepID=A0A8J2RZU1_9CRUS|nr:unnamed protein product [Daphnia galeata]
MLYVVIPVFQSFSPKDLDVLTATAIFLIATSLNLMFEGQFLLIHLSYYIIAYYMELLSLHLGDVGLDDELQVTLNKEKETNSKRSALIFEHLCQASTQLNRILSVPVLFVLTTKFLSIVTCAFACILSLIHSNEVLNDFILVFPFLFFTDWIRMLILLSAADMPVRQVRRLRERVISVNSSKFAQTLAEKVEVIITLMQINEDRVRLSAAGLFNVGVHLIPSVSAAVTYMVILLKN